MLPAARHRQPRPGRQHRRPRLHQDAGPPPDRLLGPAAAAPDQYTNVPDTGTQRCDLATYRANAGAIPGQANDGTFPDPTGAATRRFIIEVLFQAYSKVYSGDNVP